MCMCVYMGRGLVWFDSCLTGTSGYLSGGSARVYKGMHRQEEVRRPPHDTCRGPA